jgi:hypothetical protein
MTECAQQGFAFERNFSRRVVAKFSGDRLSTEGGLLLLREVNRKTRLNSSGSVLHIRCPRRQHWFLDRPFDLASKLPLTRGN